MVTDDPCPTCEGSGRGESTRTMQVRIPAGVTDGQRIRIKGKGGAGQNSGAAGDLYVLVHVSPHAVFGRKGDNLTITVPVTFPEAALGAEISVPTLDGGSVRLKIPQGTPNGRTFRVSGRGGRAADAPGDLLVTVEVRVPKHLHEDARAALADYAARASEPDPRAHLLDGRK
jgi:molecular chaperone DnaJ